MIASLLLGSAIVCDVFATISLRLAVDKKTWYAGVVIGYLISFALLALALGQGMPLGVAYGIWAATGVALTAVLSKVFFNEALTWLMGCGIALIAGGVLCLEIGSVH